jgi:hypothetical protein
VSTECQRCGRKCELFLCSECMGTLHKLLAEMPWWLDRLAETSIGQVRLGDPGRRGHRSGLERYADPKPAIDGSDGTEGERRLEQDLKDSKLRARLLAQGGVNAHASDLFDEVQNMLGSWVRDVCERRGVDVPTIGTASRMALWLRDRVSALASAECAEESYRDVHNAAERIERAVNKPPEPKTCGPCPTNGVHSADGFRIDAGAREKCGTRLAVRSGAVEVKCPTCKQTHLVETLIDRCNNDMHWMSFTVKELLNVVLPRGDTAVPRATLYKWIKNEKIKPTGYDETGAAKFMLADVRACIARERKVA